MEGQPRFLTTLTHGRKTSAVDLKSQKRKVPDGDKEPSGIRSKGNPSAKTTGKQVSKTSQSGSGTQNVVVIPPHSDSNLPPHSSSTLPPPPPLTGVPQPIIWESGVNNALSTALRPPKRFYDPTPYSDAIIRELQVVELNALKAASLTQTLASIHAKYGKALDDLRIPQEELRNAKDDKDKISGVLQVCREEKNKTYEELLKVKEDFKTVNRDFFFSKEPR